MRRIVIVALAIALVTLVSGCEEPETSAGGGVPTSASRIGLTERSTASTGDCDQPGPRIRSVLPNLGSRFPRVLTNPCVPLLDLADKALKSVPQAQRAGLAAFQSRLGALVGGANVANTVLTCAYHTDRVGIVLYQERNQPGSLGLVLAIRGSVQAAGEVAACVLKVTLFGFRDGRRTDPAKAPCFEDAYRKKGGETYSIYWIGSTDSMCKALTVLGG